MLPVVHDVVHRKWRSPNRLGRFRSWIHPLHIVGCHLQAQGLYIAGREKLTVKAPYLSLLAAGERDRNGLVGPIEMIWCSFEWPAVQREAGGERVALECFGTRQVRSHQRALDLDEVRTVLGLFRDLQALARRPGLAAQMRAGLKVVELLALWTEPPIAATGGRPAVRLYQGLIEQHALDPRVALETLAERVGYSLDHLGVLFLKELGMTAVEYRTQLRLRRARELLASTAKSVREVGREVGFDDPSYFARLFRRAFQVSPREFATQRSRGL